MINMTKLVVVSKEKKSKERRRKKQDRTLISSLEMIGVWENFGKVFRLFEDCPCTGYPGPKLQSQVVESDIPRIAPGS